MKIGWRPSKTVRASRAWVAMKVLLVGGIRCKSVGKDMILLTEGSCTEDVGTEFEGPLCDDTGNEGELSIKPLGVNNVVRWERWVQSEGPSEETTACPIDLIHLGMCKGPSLGRLGENGIDVSAANPFTFIYSSFIP